MVYKVFFCGRYLPAVRQQYPRTVLWAFQSPVASVSVQYCWERQACHLTRFVAYVVP